MTDLEQMEKRWKELVGKPRTNEEVQETLLLARTIELERAKEYSGLIKELAEIGINISSIWDLVNTKSKYPAAIPLLLKYLPIVQYDRSKEGIIRALTVPEAKGMSTAVLINEYKKASKSKENLRWVIGNAINVTVTNEDLESILLIVRDKENGVSRQMFITALGKMKSEKAEDVLIELLDDDEVAHYALETLGKIKSTRAKAKIERLLYHPKSLIKKEAQKTLKKIG